MIDSYGREITYLRLSVTDRCNLRCRYCMPEDGICLKRHEDMLTEEEMLTAVAAAAKLGITKVRITGGEPLVKKNILSICRGVAATAGVTEVCLTTNGLLLPQLARPLRQAGVHRLNLSLDTLDPAQYAHITRTGQLAQALAGLDAALGAGFDRVKLNAVLIGGFNDSQIRPLAELTRRMPVDVRFIELMPMGGEFDPGAYVPCTRVLETLPELVPQMPDGGVAALYRLPDAMGQVGLIRPISSHFCASCNRIRLTADGRLKPCLHAGAEYSLKGLTQAEMEAVMARAIAQKPLWHGVLDASHPSRAGRDMNEIGG